MTAGDEVLQALQKAVELSPDSGALRRHYAEMLLNRGYSAEAEAQFRAAVELDDTDADAKLGLARALHAQGEHSTALFLVKQVIRESTRPARAYILYARLLLNFGSVERALNEYRKGVDVDPGLHDPDLEAELGIETITSDPAVVGSPEGSETAELPALSAEQLEAPEAEEGRTPLADLEEPATIPATVERYTHTLRQLFSVRPRQTFQDVGGMTVLKDEIRTILLHPLNHRDFYRSYDKDVGGRLLVYGPPGCGKTHLARAIAGEVLAPFLAVGIHDLVDVWQEESDQVLHRIFEQAREQNPWVLFFDDIDTIGRGRTVIQQLLTEISGSNASNDGLLILIATNAPWNAEPALLRRDRFDRVIFLEPPSELDRSDILRILCRNKPQENIDFAHLASITQGFTGADLRTAVDRAVEQKLQLSLEEGRPNPLTTEDLATAASGLHPSSEPWFEHAREYLAEHPEDPRDPDGDIYAELRAYLAQHPHAAAT